jgi:hypothetical protein
VQVTDIITRVQRIFGDEEEVQISVQDILSWISDGQMEIARQTEILTKDVKFDFDPATFAGALLPADFILEKRVTWTDSSGNETPLGKTTLDMLDQGRINSKDTSTNPVSYYLWAGKVHLYPHPTTVIAQALRLWYVCAPQPTVQISDQLQIPQHMHEDVVRYALMRARELNEDPADADRIGANLTNRLVQSRAEANNPYKDQYPVVRPYAGDMGF